MAKPKRAEKKKDAPEKQSGEQQDLFELLGSKGKEIAAAAVIYKKHHQVRLSATKREVEQKTIILDLVKQAKIKGLPNGHTKFTGGVIEIDIEPRGELVKVKEVKEDW